MRCAKQNPTVEQYAMRGFADALEQICVVLAENSGIDPSRPSPRQSQAAVRGLRRLRIACLDAQVGDMRKLEVFETLASKKLQVQLASQSSRYPQDRRPHRARNGLVR